MTSLPADFNFAAVGDWECKAKTNNTANNIVGKSPELVPGAGLPLIQTYCRWLVSNNKSYRC